MIPLLWYLPLVSFGGAALFGGWLWAAAEYTPRNQCIVTRIVAALLVVASVVGGMLWWEVARLGARALR